MWCILNCSCSYYNWNNIEPNFQDKQVFLLFYKYLAVFIYEQSKVEINIHMFYIFYVD